jgi:hypothetical protein
MVSSFAVNIVRVSLYDCLFCLAGVVSGGRGGGGRGGGLS